MNNSLDRLGVIKQTVEALLSGLEDAAAVVDRDLLLLASNDRFVELSGIDLAVHPDCRGLEFSELFCTRPADAATDALRKSFRRARQYRLAELRLENVRSDTFIVWFTSLPLKDPAGEVIAVLAKIRDVSAEARLQSRFKGLLQLSRARADDLERLVEARTRELAAAYERVRQLSRRDPLTGLLNRRAFGEAAALGLAAARRHEHTAAVLMCDLDFFKQVNDRFGHPVGDAVLVEAAKTLRATLRNIDALARHGGEEFIAFFGRTSTEGARDAAERCRQALQTMEVSHADLSASLRQTGSFGVSFFPRHGDTLEELMAAADRALYQAKHGGRNRVVIFRDGEDAWGSAGQPPPAVGVAPASRLEDPDKVTERVLIIDPLVERATAYRSLFDFYYDAKIASSPAEAHALVRSEEFTIFVADVEQEEDDGLVVLDELMARCPGALRVLMVDDALLCEKLLGTNLAAIDFVLLRVDFRHLITVAENCRARRAVASVNPFLHAPQPARWALRTRELSAIVHKRQFTVAYQPIVACDNGRVHGYEVFCRIDGPNTMRLVDFFDWALREGRIWQLGSQVRQLAHCALEASPLMRFFFNLHPAELITPSGPLAEPELDRFADRVIFEVTERAAIGDLPRVRSAISRLRAKGYRFAIDDLGAGYAGLCSVSILTPDYVKVDMSIIRGIQPGSSKARLLRRIVEFAEEEGAQVVAEGVESEEEAAVVVDIGCHLMQGYFIGRPAQVPTAPQCHSPGDNSQ